MYDWGKYFETVSKPNSLVDKVLGYYLGPKESAFDLGAGNMRDSKYLLAQGFKRVVAIDEDPSAKQYTTAGIEFAEASIIRHPLPKDHFDFGISINTLFFFNREGMRLILERAHGALRPGGVFGCNILGERHDWVRDQKPDVDFMRIEDVEKLRERFQPLFLDETEWDAPTAFGVDTHWHCWNLIFQRA